MALLALRSRRLLPALTSIASRHLATTTITRSSPLPIAQSSPVAKFQSRSFQSTPVALLSSRQPSRSYGDEDKLDPNEILFEGCDYNHWLITIDFPKDPRPSAEEMVEFYVQTCAKGLNISIEEAKQKIYACSTTTYQGFQAVMTEAESENFQNLPGVVFVLPDSYIDPVNKEYGGDKYINGTIIPRPPPVQYTKRPRYNPPQRAPMQGDGRNYGPPQNIPQLPNGTPRQVSPPPPGGYPQSGRGSNFNQHGEGNYNPQERIPPPPPGGMQYLGPSQGFGHGGGFGHRQEANQGFTGSGGGYGPGPVPIQGFRPVEGGGYGNQGFRPGTNVGYGLGQGHNQGFRPGSRGGYEPAQAPNPGYDSNAGREYGPGQVPSPSFVPGAGQRPSQDFGSGANGGYGQGQGRSKGFGPGEGGDHISGQGWNQGFESGAGRGSGGNFGPGGDFGQGSQGRR